MHGCLAQLMLMYHTILPITTPTLKPNNWLVTTVESLYAVVNAYSISTILNQSLVVSDCSIKEFKFLYALYYVLYLKQWKWPDRNLYYYLYYTGAHQD